MTQTDSNNNLFSYVGRSRQMPVDLKLKILLLLLLLLHRAGKLLVSLVATELTEVIGQ